jgi:hypothetical protein
MTHSVNLEDINHSIRSYRACGNGVRCPVISLVVFGLSIAEHSRYSGESVGMLRVGIAGKFLSVAGHL